LQAFCLSRPFSGEPLQWAIQGPSQRVGQIGRFHPNEACQLKARIQAVRGALLNDIQVTQSFVTSSVLGDGAELQGDDGLPWE
jgi:hypothetical protein